MKHSQKIVAVAGKLLILASLAFIVRQILRYDVDFSVLTSPLVITGLLLTALAFGAGIVFGGFNYKWLIGNITGVSLDSRLVVRIYCVANLYKYIPGTVMFLVGRNRLAFETNKVTHPQIALSTVMEGVFVILATVIVIAFSVHGEALSYMRQVNIPAFVWLIVGGVVLVAVLLAVTFRRRLRTGFKELVDTMRNFSLAAKAKRLVTAMLMVMVLAVTYLVTLMLLGQQVTPAMVSAIIGLYLLSWFAGFITPGAAGGMGIREAVLLMFMGGYLNPAIVVSSAIMHRVVCIVGDIFAYGIASVYSRATGDSKPPGPSSIIS
ncbi:MAG: hypothetical protein FWB78_04355 [Treponema sp.]|nr:hypothetical protein [Treponema sp.]